jgi:hypothetical protein
VGLPGGFHQAAAELYRRLAGFKGSGTDVELDSVLTAARSPISDVGSEIAASPTWGEFTAAAPELAAFGAARLGMPPAYLATLRGSGTPRVHPVTPIIGDGRLFIFMEPSSPKVHDLRERGGYALHNGVPDTEGSGGEFFVGGGARLVDDRALRMIAERAASYEPAERYVLFELGVSEARCNGYGDVQLPASRRWRASPRCL